MPHPAPLPNEPLDVAGLPRLDDGHFVSVDPRHVLGGVLFLLVAALVAVVGGVVIGGRIDDGSIAVAAGAVLAASLGAAAVVSWMAARRVGLQVREHDVSLRRGLIVRTVETVPFRRVQHVSLTRGPLERVLGLATVGVHSAGPDISIPGLDPDDAGAIRRLIVTRAGLDDQDIDLDDAHGDDAPLGGLAEDRVSRPAATPIDERP